MYSRILKKRDKQTPFSLLIITQNQYIINFVRLIAILIRAKGSGVAEPPSYRYRLIATSGLYISWQLYTEDQKHKNKKLDKLKL
jgi:hypothetical protein